MKRKCTLVAVAAASTLCLQAYATDNIVVNTSTGASKFSLTDIKSLKFNEEKLLVYTLSSETPVEFNLTEIASLKFIDASTDGIDATTSDNRKFSIRYSNGAISASGLNAANTAIYNISGQRMLGIKAWDGSAIQLDNMPNGVYVITINNQTFKFVKK